MDLSDRKQKILQAIIDEYIGTAEPVGSRAISKKENLGLSSATIRNEMADLEEMGYLIQPHTSAGRIPSDEGYRFYVNSLMQDYKIGIEAIIELQNVLENRVSRLEKIIRYAGAIASSLTDYTTVITSPKEPDFKIKKIDLVMISDRTAMLIVVTRTVRSQVMNVDLDEISCREIAEILNQNLSGLHAAQITFDKIQSIQSQIENRVPLSAKTLIDIMHFVYDTITEDNETEIYVNNAKSILKYPEYSDVDKAQEIFTFLEDKENLKKLIESSSSDGIEAKIGKENDFEIMKDCSLVSMNYSLGEKTAGKLAVIGPKRMNYAKVFASLDLISSEIDKILRYYMNGE
ncbi:MAG: heat-inducible transcription repressor HrcA [Clostridia bacterium]|nr:heat-inducible transcription repressor HrcA [Clostridia bacterium]MCI9084927.1 heat-inducible transcription repressor HrcA [Clostridia bacterium]NDO18626.1 heat-inducible transcription repressor HrcA [Lachnospiraceae bacterium MD329]